MYASSMAPVTRVRGVDQRISGPAGALELHLRKFSEVHREFQYADRLSGVARGGGFVTLNGRQAHNLLNWLHFASTYSKPAAQIDPETGRLGAVDDAGAPAAAFVDGRSNAEQEIILTPETFDRATMLTSVVMAQTEYQMLDRSQTVFLSDAMKALVTEAADLAEPEPLFDSDIPFDAGLIVFETPLLLDDLHPETGDPIGKPVMPVRAIGWSRAAVGARDGSGEVEGIVLINYTDRDAYNSIFIPAMREIVSDEIEAMEADHDRWMWPIEFHPWAFGSSWVGIDHLGEQSQGKIVSPVAYNRRWVLSLFRIMWQRIIKPEHWEPTTRKQMDRLPKGRRPMMLDGEGMKVLALRRFVESTERSESAGDDVDWPHPYRIPVEPHWRRQHYPSMGPARNEDGSWNQDSHRLVFIARHARGPEHLPLKETHQVVAVVR